MESVDTLRLIDHLSLHYSRVDFSKLPTVSIRKSREPGSGIERGSWFVWVNTQTSIPSRPQRMNTESLLNLKICWLKFISSSSTHHILDSKWLFPTIRCCLSETLQRISFYRSRVIPRNVNHEGIGSWFAEMSWMNTFENYHSVFECASHVINDGIYTVCSMFIDSKEEEDGKDGRRQRMKTPTGKTHSTLNLEKRRDRNVKDILSVVKKEVEVRINEQTNLQDSLSILHFERQWIRREKRNHDSSWLLISISHSTVYVVIWPTKSVTIFKINGCYLTTWMIKFSLHLCSLWSWIPINFSLKAWLLHLDVRFRETTRVSSYFRVLCNFKEENELIW